MTWRQTLNDYIVLPVMSAFRLVYSSGQTAFAIIKFGKYAFTKDNHPVTLTWTGLAIAGNLGVNSIVKIPAIYREMGHKPTEPQAIQTIALHTSGKFVSGLFKVSGGGLIALEFISGDFGVIYLLDGFGSLIGVDFHNNLINEIFAQVVGAIGGASAAKIFHSYEYAVVGKGNSDQLGKLYEDGKYLQKIRQHASPFAKTAGVMAINLITYSMLANFWMKSATDDFAEKHGILNDTAKSVMCGIAALITFLFTLGWSPTVYEVFDDTTLAEDAANPVARPYQRNCKTQLIKGIALTCLPNDILTWAVTIFTSVISTGEDHFDADPYGAMIGLGAVCAVFAGGLYGLSLRPGVEKTLANSAAAPLGSESLLGNEAKQIQRDIVSAKALIASKRAPSPQPAENSASVDIDALLSPSHKAS
jgi:hypothetical protein